jgi:hypothetical protein
MGLLTLLDSLLHLVSHGRRGYVFLGDVATGRVGMLERSALASSGDTPTGRVGMAEWSANVTAWGRLAGNAEVADA